ncbi:hypothetical protein [uncultured Anaerovibrio sp.]|uniref:hypothetical protein n=1 Tax=uncultured Anaerovibrio sp. TaxID=361586 RepID=UPI0025D22920|nr:hypothetical protein [uncultured Anaerovibrio sp.]
MVNIMNSNRWFMGIWQGCILFFLLLNYVFHNISFGAVISVFLYQLFAWYLAGRVLVSFFKIRVNSYAEELAFSYTFGGISSVIIYLIFMVPGLGFLLPVATIGEAVASVYYLHKKRIHIDDNGADGFGMSVSLIFFFIYLFLSFCAVSLVNTFPNETFVGTGYYVDWPFWAGNNISFTNGFPADNFRQPGYVFKYHFFSSILMAQVSLCTGVDINWISFYFSSILGGIIFVLSGFYFATRLATPKWLVVAVMIAALFTDGRTVTFAWHTNICPFGFDYGFAYGMMSIAFLVEIINNGRYKELFIPSCFFLAMTTGCKGPIGLVILVAYGIASLSYVLNKMIKQGIISGMAWLSSFVVVYLLFIHCAGTFEEASGLQYIGGFGINTIVTKAKWVAYIYNGALSSWVVPMYNSLLSPYSIAENSLLLKICSLWLYIYRANNVVITMLIITIGVMVYDANKRNFDLLMYCFFISSLMGVLLAIYTTQSGGSQMYFMMGMFPSAIMAGGYAIKHISNIVQEKRDFLWIYRTICIIILFTLGISLHQYCKIVMAKVDEGLAVVTNSYPVGANRELYADPLDYEAFEWLKNNTDINSLVATDSFTDIYGRKNNMLMGVFSKRYIWNEKKYVPDANEAARRNELVTGIRKSPDEYIGMLKDEGVDYFVYQCFDGKAEYASSSRLLTEVFRNDHYIIYKIHN